MTPTHWSRDVRLDVDQLMYAEDNARKRVRALEKRLERTSYMKDAVLRELNVQREMQRVFDHNLRELRRKIAADVMKVA